ncbi:hypothetical protein GCM10023196_091250 [Actinoallomurus vinaceus]|uniref:Uncharacterized protein n=1 Tax=Actinoallomurus vinaceus TaxID=1080074 RepID=A0ABP8UR32_9ACTN
MDMEVGLRQVGQVAHAVILGTGHPARHLDIGAFDRDRRGAKGRALVAMGHDNTKDSCALGSWSLLPVDVPGLRLSLRRSRHGKALGRAGDPFTCPSAAHWRQGKAVLAFRPVRKGPLSEITGHLEGA